MTYKKTFLLTFDTSELDRYIKKLERASRDKSKISRYHDSISTTIILRKSAPTAIMELIRYTPSGEEGSNWGPWDYGDYYLYGGDHSKNTLKRGWVVKHPSMAEYKAFWMPNLRDAEDFVEGNVYVKNGRFGRSQYLDLENALEYAVYVEYGHHIVLPGERSANKSTRGGSRAVRHAPKVQTFGRWVPGKYFVEGMPKSAWMRVSTKMHEEYLKQLKEVLRND